MQKYKSVKINILAKNCKKLQSRKYFKSEMKQYKNNNKRIKNKIKKIVALLIITGY